MTNYIGVKCPVCSKKFTRADDIVVCPICGAPHHRDCYKQTNECAFIADHPGGKVWRNPQEPPTTQAEQQEVRACPICGRYIPQDALYCQHCGSSMQTRIQKDTTRRSAPGRGDGMGWSGGDFSTELPHMGFMQIELPDTMEDTATEDLNKFVGRSQVYYLPRFFAMHETGRKVSPNFSALFFNFFYFLYRKMYLIGFFLLGVNIISMIPGMLYSWETIPLLIRDLGLEQAFAGIGVVLSVDQVNMAAVEHYVRMGNITQMISFAINIGFSLFANRIYFSKCVRDIAKIRAEAATQIQEGDPQFKNYCDTSFARRGGISWLIPVGVTLAVLAVYFVATYVSLYNYLLG